MPYRQTSEVGNMTAQRIYKLHKLFSKLPASIGKPMMVLLMRYSVLFVVTSGFNALTVACYEYTLKEGKKICLTQKNVQAVTRK
jgi:hypothetical protein